MIKLVEWLPFFLYEPKIQQNSIIWNIVEKHGFCSLSYADDMQLYAEITQSNRVRALTKFEDCIEDSS